MKLAGDRGGQGAQIKLKLDRIRATRALTPAEEAKYAKAELQEQEKLTKNADRDKWRLDQIRTERALTDDEAAEYRAIEAVLEMSWAFEQGGQPAQTKLRLERLREAGEALSAEQEAEYEAAVLEIEMQEVTARGGRGAATRLTLDRTRATRALTQDEVGADSHIDPHTHTHTHTYSDRTRVALVVPLRRRRITCWLARRSKFTWRACTVGSS